MAALAVGGAGCAARSLVQLEMDVAGDPATIDVSSAKLRIVVKQEGTTIRNVEAVINQLADWPTAHPKVGVFLGAHVSGQVTITITIVDRQECTIGRADREIVVDVKPGQTSSVTTITIVITEPICPPSQDAGLPPAEAGTAPETGVDAGTPGEDAVVIASDGADDVSATEAAANDGAAATDVYCPPEAGTEVPTPPTCDQFCDAATNNCPQYYPKRDQCMEVCRTWRPGTVSSTTDNGLGENTIGCRLWFATNIIPALVDRYCQNASEHSPICNK